MQVRIFALTYLHFFRKRRQRIQRQRRRGGGRRGQGRRGREGREGQGRRGREGREGQEQVVDERGGEREGAGGGQRQRG